MLYFIACYSFSVIFSLRATRLINLSLNLINLLYWLNLTTEILLQFHHIYYFLFLSQVVFVFIRFQLVPECYKLRTTLKVNGKA